MSQQSKQQPLPTGESHHHASSHPRTPHPRNSRPQDSRSHGPRPQDSQVHNPQTAQRAAEAGETAGCAGGADQAPTLSLMMQHVKECTGVARGVRHMMLDEPAIKRAAQDFHSQRMEKGLVEADGAWFAPAVDEWMDALAGGEARLSEESLLHIAAGTRETLSMRDAMLVSILCPLTRMSMKLLASDPHDVNSAKTVYDALNGVFRDPGTFPDAMRCATGLRLFSEVVEAVPRKDRAHPLACVAYICWWMGFLDESRRCSDEALRIDPGCSLASIILTAAEFNVLPAWADSAVDERNAGDRQ